MEKQNIKDYFKNMAPSIIGDLLNILDKAIESDNADMGSIQVFDKNTQTLHIIAQKGFANNFTESLLEVKPFDSSVYGRAIGIGNIIVISDIHEDMSSLEFRMIAKQSGYRAVKSIPLSNKHNDKLGVISTHFRDKKWNWNLNSLNHLTPELTMILQKIAEDLTDLYKDGRP